MAGKGVPFNAVAVNDPINFAISARNLDSTNSRAAQFLKADGTVLFQADASGVKVSPDGTVASVPVTVTSTQTLTNKTFTSPHVTGLVVDSGGETVASGNVTLTAAATQQYSKSGGTLQVGTSDANSLQLFTNGVGRLTFDSAGNSQFNNDLLQGSSTAAALRFKRIATLANTGIVQFPDAAGGALRLCLIIGDDGRGAVVMCQGAGTAVTFIGGLPTGYSATQGNAATTNIYWNAGNNRYELQNNTGATRNYTVIMVADG